MYDKRVGVRSEVGGVARNETNIEVRLLGGNKIRDEAGSRSLGVRGAALRVNGHQVMTEYLKEYYTSMGEAGIEIGGKVRRIA